MLKDKVCLFDSGVFASYPTARFGSVAIHMMAGLLMIVGIMVLATWNDIVRLF